MWPGGVACSCPSTKRSHIQNKHYVGTYSIFIIPIDGFLYLVFFLKCMKIHYLWLDTLTNLSYIFILPGSQIINIALLVIDITKGIETQTAECLVVAEITCNKMVLVLNKIDLLAEETRDTIIAKTTKKLKITLAGTKFKDAPIVSVSASPNDPSAAIGNMLFSMPHQKATTWLFLEIE